MGKRVRAGLIIGAISACLLLILWAGDLFVRLRLQLNDVYFLNTPVTDHIVLIAIDDDSLSAYGRTPVEWSRSLFADLVQILGEAKTRVVAFDILFAQATPDDEQFAEAMRAARAGEGRTRFMMPIVGVERASGSANGGIRFEQVLRPTDTLTNAVDYFGFVNVFADADEKVRRQPSSVEAGIESGYSFGMTAFLAYLRIPSAAVSQVITRGDNMLTIASEHHIPVDDLGFWRQNFFTPSDDESGFTTVSFQDVLNGTVDPALFEDKIVMVGLMNSVNAPDERATPLQISMAGVEIHAHALETLLQGVPLTEQTRISEALTIILLCIVSSLVYVRLRWYWMLPLAFALVAVWAIFAFVTFSTAHILINLFHPFLALTLPLIGNTGWQITSEINRRRSAEHWLGIIQRQKELLETVLGGSPTGIVVLDRFGCFNSANRAFTEAFGFTKPMLANKHFIQLMQDAALPDEARQKLSEGIQQFQPFRMEFKHQSKTFMVDAATLPSDERWVIIFHDVSVLAELSEIKTHMIRMLSHDLKNPLASVIGFSELLITGVTGDSLADGQRKFVEHIRRAANSMLMIINETLSMEQLRSGRMRKRPLDLAEQIQEVSRMQESDAEQREQIFTLDLEEGVPPVMGDAFQLSQAITNLISNALKYTQDGGTITVRLRRVEAWAHIEIEDNGYGMSETAQANLFKEFFRAEATAHIKGTGLGLSLVKAITEAHGGLVKFKSVEGKGSTFTLELPLALEGVAV